jgi:hypothetical protein
VVPGITSLTICTQILLASGGAQTEGVLELFLSIFKTSVLEKLKKIVQGHTANK